VLAAQLGALGFVDDAERAFGIVGQAGLRGGQVALAVACGRLLAQRGNMRGPELLEDVAASYCRGSELVSDDAVPSPHAEAVELPAGAAIALGASVEAEVAAVRLALEVLEPVATRGPEGGKLPPAPLLSSLPLPGARALIGVVTARTALAGEILVEVGQPATSLYWLAYGDVAVSRDGVTLGELHGGGFFGEIALVGGTTRTAQVVARSDVWLLELPARAVEAAAQRHPQLAEVLAAHAKARLLANLTRTSELFRELPAADLGALLEKFGSKIVEAGTRIIAEGEPNAHLWVVVAGRCDVRSAGAEMARLGPGAAVGEISLVSGKPAVADVVAVERSVLLRLSREDFRAQVAHSPELLERVESLVVAREQANRALFHDASDLLV
jgi:CRP-like cAMP-binding protein